MRLIVAAADAVLLERLVSALHEAGHSTDEIAHSPADLERRLEALEAAPSGTPLVVTGPVWRPAEPFARVAREHGVPIALWPLQAAGASAPEPGSERRLSDREHEVLALIAAGVSDKGIARRLGLSPNTVKFHIAGVRAKLGASTRAEAVAAAARRGELSL
jgi:DNA-binding CsgD family transcriptional regulator